MIAVYFGASTKVVRIRRQFAISERVEQLQNDPVYQAQMKQMQNMMQNGGMQMGPMGPMSQPMNQPSQPVMNPQGTQQTNNTINEPLISKEEKELKEMTIAQLKQVAKKLSISGTSTMKKAELIKAILRVTDK